MKGVKMKKKYYLAYGSNLNIQQMGWRCPTAEPVGTAMLEGWQLAFKGSKSGAYLTIEPREGGIVPLGVWRITEADEQKLDCYEGFPRFYYKEKLRVVMQDLMTGRDRSVEALIYIMREVRPYGVPSPAYVRTCVRGYMDFDLDLGFLQGALDRLKEEVI